MFVEEIFVLESVSIDALSPGAILVDDVASLNHEATDDSVKNGTFVMERFSIFTYSFFSGAKTFKIFSCHWTILKKCKNSPLNAIRITNPTKINIQIQIIHLIIIEELTLRSSGLVFDLFLVYFQLFLIKDYWVYKVDHLLDCLVSIDIGCSAGEFTRYESGVSIFDSVDFCVAIEFSAADCIEIPCLVSFSLYD
jgi:hypothetical protein